MTYEDLKNHFHLFQIGETCKLELAFAIHLWQRSNGYTIVDMRKEQ